MAALCQCWSGTQEHWDVAHSHWQKGPPSLAPISPLPNQNNPMNWSPWTRFWAHHSPSLLFPLSHFRGHDRRKWWAHLHSEGLVKYPLSTQSSRASHFVSPCCDIWGSDWGLSFVFESRGGGSWMSTAAVNNTVKWYWQDVTTDSILFISLGLSVKCDIWFELYMLPNKRTTEKASLSEWKNIVGIRWIAQAFKHSLT